MLAAFKKNFIEFGNLVGCINFDSDADYDDCHGWIKLSVGPEADDILIYEAFTGPYERNSLMQTCFEKSAEAMARYARAQKDF